MKDHSHDSLAPIIAHSNKNNSCSLHTPEDIGPQVSTCHAIISRKLNRRPPFRVDQSLVTQPLGDGLLADGRTVHELGDTFRKSGLAACDFDSAPQRDNVVLLHRRRGYTTKVVRVNNFARSPSDNGICTVLTMPASARKRIVQPRLKPEVERNAIRDAEGHTLGDRLKIGMKGKGRMLGHTYTAKDLLADASRLIGRGPNDPPIQTQQALSKILTDKISESAATPAYAQVLGLNPLWLGYGVGPRCVIETLDKPRK